MRIVIINSGEPSLFSHGYADFGEYMEYLRQLFPEVKFDYYHTGIEWEVINYLHQDGFDASGIILNPGKFTYYSVSIGDAIAAIKATVIVVIQFDETGGDGINYICRKAKGSLTGFGCKGYEMAVRWLIQ